MKKLKALLSFLLVVVIAINISYADEFSDYVSEIRGDTAVVKTYDEYGANSLLGAIQSDTTEDGERANPDRVYYLKRGGMYLNDAAWYYTPPGESIEIVGGEGDIIKPEKDVERPPIVSGIPNSEGSAVTGYWIQPGSKSNVKFKNIAFMNACSDGSKGSGLMWLSDSSRVTFENCLFEHNTWAFLPSNKRGMKVYIRDCLFLNMVGNTVRRNGGVYDNYGSSADSLVVENSTHLIGSGFMYKIRNYPFRHIYFNHNTFVNCSNNIIEGGGMHLNMIFTNNLIVNSNYQPYYPGLDYGETDQDSLPTGIINVDTLEGIGNFYPDGFPEEDRKVLVDNNAVYWDPRLDQILNELRKGESDTVDWQSQMITMNDRTQAMFNDDESYPYLTEGEWIKGEEPGFLNMKDLMEDMIFWGINNPADDNEYVQQAWREQEEVIVPDWPVLADLSYTNSKLKTGGSNGMPVGDLNWFPSKKEEWEAQKETYHNQLYSALNNGEPVSGVEDSDKNVQKDDFELLKNYPNPFNPTTTIQYRIGKPGSVKLTVYNVMGQKVKTLVNSYKSTGKFSVKWNGVNEKDTKVSSGLYFYKLQTGNKTQMRKMILLK